MIRMTITVFWSRLPSPTNWHNRHKHSWAVSHNTTQRVPLKQNVYYFIKLLFTSKEINIWSILSVSPVYVL